jgi:hypothetical protein
MNLIAEKILDLLKENLAESRNIKRFYLGNPIELASADLPAIFVQPLRKTVTQLDNVYDDMNCEFLIGICADPAKYQRRDSNEATAESFLMEIEGGRNDDGTPMTNTVTYVMRNHFTLENTAVYQEHEAVWGAREMTGGVAKEIHLYFNIRVKIKNIS